MAFKLKIKAKGNNDKNDKNNKNEKNGNDKKMPAFLMKGKKK